MEQQPFHNDNGSPADPRCQPPPGATQDSAVLSCVRMLVDNIIRDLSREEAGSAELELWRTYGPECNPALAAEIKRIGDHFRQAGDAAQARQVVFTGAGATYIERGGREDGGGTGYIILLPEGS